MRVEDVDQQSDDGARGVVLAGLLVRLVGEPLDQVLVGVAEHVRGDAGVAERLGREVLDQVGEFPVGQLVLVRPAGAAEDAVEGVGVGRLDRPEGRLQSRTDVLGPVAHIPPQVAVRDREPVILGERGVLVVTAGLIKRALELLGVDVTDPLEEHQGEDVGLEICLVDTAAQQVRRASQILLQLGQRQSRGRAILRVARGELHGGGKPLCCRPLRAGRRRTYRPQANAKPRRQGGSTLPVAT